MWFERLEGSGLWLETWLRHQRRDGYWRHGSIAEDYAAVQCPVMAVSGWADGYSNAVFRLLANLDVPRRGLVGPWSHKYPHIGVPGPAIGFLQECVRWWDHWLKGKETGVMDDPMLRVWMQDSVLPSASYDTRPGRWVAEPVWPSENVTRRRFGLAQGRILQEGEQGRTDPLAIQSPLSLGLFAGKWCSYAAGPDLAHDQREEDGGALVFDSAPLSEPLEILGMVCVELELSADRPLAMVALSLSGAGRDDREQAMQEHRPPREDESRNRGVHAETSVETGAETDSAGDSDAENGGQRPPIKPTTISGPRVVERPSSPKGSPRNPRR